MISLGLSEFDHALQADVDRRLSEYYKQLAEPNPWIRLLARQQEAERRKIFQEFVRDDLLK